MSSNGSKTRRGTCDCWDNISQKVNDGIEWFFAAIGLVVSKIPYIVIAAVLFLLAIVSIGYTNISFETNIFDLWRPYDSPVWDEEKFIEGNWEDKDYGLMGISATAKNDDKDMNLLAEDYLDEWYKFHLQLKSDMPYKTYTYEDSSGVEQSFELSFFGNNYEEPAELIPLGTLVGQTVPGYALEVIPLCRLFAISPLEAQFQLPCYMFTLFDCFSEGGYFFPYNDYLSKTFFTNLASDNPYTYKSSFHGLTQVELGSILAPSCSLWSGTVVPSNFLYGGEDRINSSDPQSLVLSIHAFETVLFIDSAAQLARKLQIARADCLYAEDYAVSCDTLTDDQISEAEDIIFDWLELYIDYLLPLVEEHNADDDSLLDFQFWTPRTSRDLLLEASTADFGLLAIAYIAMIFFASLTAMKPSNGFLSKSEVSFAGVILVLITNVCTIGFASWFVTLSPNVVQVLPFIALGFGVDDMFVLLFAFKYREKMSVSDMIKETTRIAGSSVALTSLANFFGFLIGSTMALPDVRTFSICGMLIVIMNFIAVIFGFTGMLTLTARRMDHGYKDWSFLFCWADCMKAEKKFYEKPSATAPSMFDPLFDWLTKNYTRGIMVFLFLALAVVGLYGMTLITPGLPLADIVPQDFYGSEFLAIREEYFHSYVIDIYTDADGADLRGIDWPNKFEDWITTTEEIYSISDLVETDAAVHSFWAWKLQAYLVTQHAEYLGSYKLGDTFSLDDDEVYLSASCETDRLMYCSSIDVYYVESSSLYTCLYANYLILSDDCVSYIDQITSSTEYAFAEQIYLYDYETNDYGVSGLYVRPAGSDIQVYSKYPNSDGYIYQENCGNTSTSYCKWYVLDANNEAVYVGLSTPISRSQPSTAGWIHYSSDDTNITYASVFHLYFDFVIYVVGAARPNVFLYSDTDVVSTFSFDQSYEVGNDEKNAAACLEADPIRLLMADYESYSDISLSVGMSSDSLTTVTCDAITDSSRLCRSFRDETTLGGVECGSFEGKEDEDRIDISEWFTTNECTESWTMMAIDAEFEDTIVDAYINSVGCGCDTPSNWSDSFVDLMTASNATAMYFSPCALDEYGAVGVTSNSSDGQCGGSDLELALECKAQTTCDNLEVCFADFYSAYVYFDESCGGTQSIIYYLDALRDGFDASVGAKNIAKCLFSRYDELSTCCKTAISTVLFPSSTTLNASQVFTCPLLGFYGRFADNTTTNTELLCEVKDRCTYNLTSDNDRYDCSAWCYDDIWADCQYVSDDYNCVNDSITDVHERQLSYMSCVNMYADKDFSLCCTASTSTYGETYANCSISLDTYYDYTLMMYDYTDCSDDEIWNVSCGMMYNGTDAQLECMQSMVSMLDDGCCKKAVSASINSYIFTEECAADAKMYLGASVANSQTALLPHANISSTNCRSMLTEYCVSDDGNEWSPTAVGSTATLDCATGYSGTRTRACSLTNGAATWGDANVGGCTDVFCAEVTEDGVTWPLTLGGYVHTLKGSYEVSDTLKLLSNSDAYGYNCSDDEENDYFSRRKCIIEDNSASWAIPTVDCRPALTYDISYSTTTCDVYTDAAGIGYFYDSQLANLVSVIPASYLFNDYTVGSAYWEYVALLIFQAVCDGTSHCAAFTYDYSNGYAYFYDWCPIVTEAEIQGTIDDIVELTFYGEIEAGVSVLAAAAVNATLYNATNLPLFEFECENSNDSDIIAVYQYLCTTDVTCCARYLINVTYYDTISSDAYATAIATEVFTQMATTYATAIAATKISKFAALEEGIAADLSEMVTYIAPLELVELTAQRCSINTGGDVLPSEAWSATGIPMPDCFNNTLWMFFKDPSGGVLYQDKMYFYNSSAVYSPTGYDNVQIKSTYNTFTLRGIDDDQVAVTFIIKLRERLQEWEDDELYVVPGGLVINLYSQYIGVEESLAKNLGYVSIAVMLVGFVFLLNPIAVFVALLCNCAMIVEVYGFCDWLGLRINGVLVLNMVIAIGLTMEFTAHIARAYVMTSASGRNICLPFATEGQIRMKKTLREMFTPVSLGALTTLLGVAPISAAKFPYFRQYYFTLYVMIVFFGWLNGVIFQPILLSFYPPASFNDDEESEVNSSHDGPVTDGTNYNEELGLDTTEVTADGEVNQPLTNNDNVVTSGGPQTDGRTQGFTAVPDAEIVSNQEEKAERHP